MSARSAKGAKEELPTAPADDAEAMPVGGPASPAAEQGELDELRAVLRAQGEHIAALELRVEEMADTIASHAKMLARASDRVLSPERFEEMRTAGVRFFTVASDCRHTKIGVRAGTTLDVLDYDAVLLHDLVKHGRLQLRQKTT